MSLSLLKKCTAKVAEKINHFVLAVVAQVGFATHAIADNGKYDFNGLVTNGKSIEDVAENAEDSFSLIFNVIKALGVLVGLVFVFMGVLRLKKSQDQNSGVSPMQGIILIIVGGLMAVLPWLLITSATTVSG